MEFCSRDRSGWLPLLPRGREHIRHQSFALGRNARERLMFGLRTNLVKVIEILVACRRGDYRSHGHQILAKGVDVSRPGARCLVILDWSESLRPEPSSVLIDHQRPNLVPLRQVFQRPPYSVSVNPEFFTAAGSSSFWRGLVIRICCSNQQR
jgi:hypothetical protein